jgi:SpoVK/Ycf46/Vps4 family AAA+-type ATPase
VRLEPGRLFGGTVGASEANLRRMLHVAERAAPIVLWIDEIDKGFAGSEGAASDAGTAARVLGGLLTWLQERAEPVFVVATANRIDALPPELLRRGRLDEIFFVDLPDADEREAILRVHAAESRARAKKSHPAFAALVRAAEGRSGAEIAAAVAEARLRAFADGRALEPSDLQAALEQIIPLSVVRAEEIAALRAWAARRARRA